MGGVHLDWGDPEVLDGGCGGRRARGGGLCCCALPHSEARWTFRPHRCGVGIHGQESWRREGKEGPILTSLGCGQSLGVTGLSCPSPLLSPSEHGNKTAKKQNKKNKPSWALVGGMQHGAAAAENGMTVPQKVKNAVTMWPCDSTCGCMPPKQKAGTHTDTCTPTFTAALFATA